MNEQSKMILRLTALISALMVSCTAISAVTITVPEDIKIVAVNGQEINGGFLSKSQYKINAGESTLSVRYSGYYQHADNSHDILKSGIVAIKTPSLKDGETYKLALLEAPKDFDEAKKYKDQPIFALYNKQNTLLAQQQGDKAEQKNWFSNTVLLSDTKNAGELSTAKMGGEISNQNTLKNEQKVNSENSQIPLIQLWQQSSKQERQKFMSWLAEQ